MHILEQLDNSLTMMIHKNHSNHHIIDILEKLDSSLTTAVSDYIGKQGSQGMHFNKQKQYI
uniref:Uncharacterized protein n=1 Tax=Arundo donax TaxID=35708 RepID=A0A0A8ZQ17_ARUDO